MRSRAFQVGWRSLLSCVLWGCSGWLFARDPVRAAELAKSRAEAAAALAQAEDEWIEASADLESAMV